MRIQELGLLVVDDVNAVRAQLKELLKSVGFEKVFIAANGVEATQFLEMIPIQVVLADWHMVPMDGLQLLQFVRKKPELKNIVFIMVTADGTREQVVQAIQNGVDDYMLKPLKADDIQKKVLTHIGKRKVLV